MRRFTPERLNFARAALVLFAAAALPGCGTISEETASAALISPNHFALYTCSDLETRAKSLRIQQADFERLMARASEGTAGGFVNTIAYKTEYMQVRGELDLLNKVVAEKRCASESKYSSGRAVF